MSLNASGIRDTARLLRISTDTVLSEIRKKEAVLESSNSALLTICLLQGIFVVVTFS